MILINYLAVIMLLLLNKGAPYFIMVCAAALLMSENFIMAFIALMAWILAIIGYIVRAFISEEKLFQLYEGMKPK